MAAKKGLLLKATDKPDSELVVIMLNTELGEAYGKLRLKFGDRLLMIYESKLRQCFYTLRQAG